MAAPTPTFDPIDRPADSFKSVDHREKAPTFDQLRISGGGLIVFTYQGLGDEVLGLPWLGGGTTIVGTAEFTPIDRRG